MGEIDDALQTDPDVLYRKGDASATGFRPASWSYQPPPANGEAFGSPHATSVTRDQKVPSEEPSSPPKQSNLPSSGSSPANGLASESSLIPGAGLPEATVARISESGSEPGPQAPAADPIMDPLRERLSPPAARDLHKPHQTAIVRLPEPSLSAVSVPAAQEPVLDLSKSDDSLSSANAHLVSDHTALASKSQSSPTAQNSVSETPNELGTAQTRTIPRVLDQAAIARLLEPSPGSDVLCRSAQLLDRESHALVISPPGPSALAHEAANSSLAMVEIATERTALEGRIDVIPSSAELGSPCAENSQNFSPIDTLSNITNTSTNTTKPLVDSTAEESVSANGKVFAELGFVIESVLTERKYGLTREPRVKQISRDSLDTKTMFSDSLLNELHAAKGSKMTPPEPNSLFSFRAVAAVAMFVALVGCAVWAGLLHA